MKSPLSLLLFMLLAAAALTGCLSRPDAPFLTFNPTPTASVVGNTVTVKIGIPMFSSGYAISHSRIVGRQLQVYCSITLFKPTAKTNDASREFQVHLPKNLPPESVEVIWINPDGSTFAVPTTRN